MPPRRKPPTCKFCDRPSTTQLGKSPVCATCEPVARQVIADKLAAVYAQLQADLDAYWAEHKEGTVAA